MQNQAVEIVVSQPIGAFVRKALKWLLKALIGVVVIVITLVATLLLVMWREHETAITLPATTGDFAVGRGA